MDYQSGVKYPDPYCIACGSLIGFLELWGENGFRRGFSHLPAMIEPNKRVQWGSLYRAIFQPRTGSQTRLSGVGRWDYLYTHRLKVTWDTDSNNIYTPQDVGLDPNRPIIYALNFLNPYNFDGRDWDEAVGYIVHANCWELLERRFLGLRARSNLDLLLEICYERFKENPYDIHEFEPKEGGGRTSTPTERWVPPEGLLSSHSYDNLGKGDDGRTIYSISLRDPLKIPEIAKLIRRSKQKKSTEVMKRKTRRWSVDTILPAQNQGRIRSSEYQQISRLSLDVIFLILDNLPNHVDLRNALTAFNWMKIPDTYWKSRVPRDLIFELDEISNDGIDWKFLFFQVCELQESLPELKNRRRVLGLLGEISKRFLERFQPAQTLRPTN